MNNSWTQLCSDSSQQLFSTSPGRKREKKQEILIKKGSVQTIGSRGAIPTYPRLKAVDLAKVGCPTAQLRIAFCGSCLRHWTSQLVLPLLAPLESWSLFSWVSRCLFDILLTCAFAKQGIVLLLIGQDLVSREECVCPPGYH